MKLLIYNILRSHRIIFRLFKKNFQEGNKLQGHQDYSLVELFDQEANNYISALLKTNKPCLISKFGTIELENVITYYIKEGGLNLRECLLYIQGVLPRYDINDALNHLCTNAGFFPNDKSLLKRFYEEYYNAMQEIDVLGSYVRSEILFKDLLLKAKKVNLDGYYAPFYWDNPWTMNLEGKNVLVVHPFSEEIKHQYANRSRIWSDHRVLPDFNLITYKAVQSMAGSKTEYNSWFDALDKMKDDIKKIEFDIALIGCGAYGMPLAAYCKQLGKQAIHLAGWLQILFGIIGKRWENNSRISQLINDAWIRPYSENVPENASKIEDGCYW